jgi:protein-ribulosamine 3-kinase
VLPPGEKILKIVKHVYSSWASTRRLVAESSDGRPASYFLKVTTHSRCYGLANHSRTLKIILSVDADERVLGEYEAMRAIYDTAPNFAPEPLGYGKCVDQDGHFFICRFLHIDHNTLPEPVSLAKKLAELHKNSVSPTGMFGFHCKTFDGKLPLNTAWESSWTKFFTTLIQDVYNMDVKVNGFWQELDEVMQVTYEKLIPRLLDPLTAEGRSIKPSLIHGDLWESNIGTDVQTKEVYIFDACSYYAHHEKEVAIWRCEHHRMTDEKYRSEYFMNNPPSEPQEEYDDRNRLYAVETLLINSAHFPGHQTRQDALSELKLLIEKFVSDDATPAAAADSEAADYHLAI